MTEKPSAGKGSLDQRRAKHAWEVVQRVNTIPDKDKNKKVDFRRQAKRLPVQIVTSGLGQALAFLKAKDYAPDLQDAVRDWMNTRIPVTAGGSPDLVERIVNGDSDFLRRATDEVLAYMQWLTRFAEANLPKDDQQ